MRRIAIVAVGLAACTDVRDDDAAPTAASLADADTQDPSAADTSAEKLDANGPGGLLPPPACASVMPGQGGSLGDLDFSYVWISNSMQGTVSKIDTESGIEVARYFTSAREGDGDPSRTAVNPAGDVAVTSRAGAVTKIAAFLDRCEDRDEDGVIDTSSGPDDVLPFGTDECVRWSVELPGGGGDPKNHQGPRPTGWDAGTPEDPCSRLWVGWYEQAQNRGRFQRHDGTDGAVLDEVTVDDWDVAQTGRDWGPYGGAVDQQGDLWVVGWGGPLVRIDATTLEVSRWETPAGTHPYGIALDADGHPWTSGMSGDVLHFDPDAQTFESLVLDTGAGPRILRGLAIDRDGVAWIAANSPCGLVTIDTATHALISDAVELPDCSMPVGVGIDVQGRVWVPDSVENVAYRRDPSTGAVVRTEGLVAPYTYSDMTGAGLELVLNPQG